MSDAKVASEPVKSAPPQPAAASTTVTFKLNGQDVTVPKGTTVMKAATDLGVKIPHFCWHPGLSIAGVCRFCMVKVEGRPKLEIACNLQAADGMDVKTDTQDTKEAHKWALEFHLLNHPLDCPICDQAGECGLQDYYMSVGKYKSQMERPKVLKPKALDVGEDLVLDTERCILCSRCVRFEEEVTKTDALGIFDRGDRSIIGTYPGKKITHNYQTNLVDICPVGAFTSRDFRFKQRVWFLKDKPSICPGCSTGCHVDVYAKPEIRTYFRIKPRESSVNGHWMCDVGRDTYRHLNMDVRLRYAMAVPHVQTSAERIDVTFETAIEVLKKQLAPMSGEDICLLVSAQYTNEEYDALFEYFVKRKNVKKVFQWREPTEKLSDFDGLLYRGDHNANTQGLLAIMKKFGVGSGEVKSQFDEALTSRSRVTIALTPELASTFPSLKDQLTKLSKVSNVTVWSILGDVESYDGFKHILPLKGFAEKAGHFTNHEGELGALNDAFPCAVKDARDVIEIVRHLES